MTDKQPKHEFDVVIPRGPAEDGKGMDVVRLRPEGVTVGRFFPVREGKPLLQGAELLKVRPRPNTPVMDVESVCKPEEVGLGEHHGPPKVVSDAYRTGWDAIFGRRETSADEIN